MINMEDYKDLIDEIRKLSDEEARCEVTTSVTTEGDVCEHGNSYASNCSDCDEIEYATLALPEVIDDKEDKMKMRIDNYIESMVDERAWK